MSTPRRGGLGKGLGALLATAPAADPAEDRPPAATDAQSEDVAETTGADAPADDTGADTPAAPPAAAVSGVRLVEIDPTEISRNPRQPREVFDQEEIDQLATSLLDVGVLQPLVVRPLGDDRYELVAGERRMRAAIAAGLPTVPAIVRATEDADLLKEALVENIHRVQLNPLEEAAAYQQLLDDFGVTQEDLAARLGRSRPTISNTIRLLSLPAGVQRRIAAGVITAGHAKALLSLESAAAQQRLADRVVAEGLSVRATEEAARLLQDEGGDTPDGGGGGSRSSGSPTASSRRACRCVRRRRRHGCSRTRKATRRVEGAADRAAAASACRCPGSSSCRTTCPTRSRRASASPWVRRRAS